MAKFTGEQQLFVVQSLATFRTPTEVKALLKLTYGVDSELNQIVHYDPNTAAGAKLAKPLREAFAKARETFINDRESLAIAHVNWRIRELEELYRQAKEKGNRGAAAKLLEQAAMDEGGKFTNKREISGPGGKPIEINSTARDAAAPELDKWRKEQAAALTDLMTPPTE